MGFFVGFLLGSRGPSDGFWRNLVLMLAWGLPLAVGKLVAVNTFATAFVPASLAAYAAMIAFILRGPATSPIKLSLIDGAIAWSRLMLVIFAVGVIWNLSDAHFVIWRAVGVARDLALCGLAIGFEALVRWWIVRDVALREIIIDDGRAR